jgi:hypothetical protein
MRNDKLLGNIVLPKTIDKKGKPVKIKITNGLHIGKTFEAKKVEEMINEKLTTFYYVTDEKIKMFFLAKDVSEIKS